MGELETVVVVDPVEISVVAVAVAVAVVVELMKELAWVAMAEWCVVGSVVVAA